MSASSLLAELYELKQRYVPVDGMIREVATGKTRCVMPHYCGFCGASEKPGGDDGEGECEHKAYSGAVLMPCGLMGR